MSKIGKFVGRTLSSPAGAVEAPCPAPHDLLNVGPGDVGARAKVGQVLRGVSAPVRGAADLSSTLAAVGAIATVDEISGADIVPESVKDTVLESSRSVMDTIGSTLKSTAETVYEGAYNALPEWVKTGVELSEYIPDFMSVSAQVMQYLISNIEDDASNIVLLAQLVAAVLVTQAIAAGLGVLNVRRTKIDRFLSAGVKASVAAVLGHEAYQAFNGNADLIGDIPVLISPNQITDMQAEGHWLLDEAQRQNTWGKTALSAAGLATLWAAWDGLKSYTGEIGLLERRKGGTLDRIVGTSGVKKRKKLPDHAASEGKKA